MTCSKKYQEEVCVYTCFIYVKVLQHILKRIGDNHAQDNTEWFNKPCTLHVLNLRKLRDGLLVRLYQSTCPSINLSIRIAVVFCLDFIQVGLIFWFGVHTGRFVFCWSTRVRLGPERVGSDWMCFWGPYGSDRIGCSFGIHAGRIGCVFGVLR